MTAVRTQTARRALRGAAVVLTGIASLAVLPGAFAAASDAATGYAERPLSIIAGSSGLGAFTPSSADPKLLERLNKKVSMRSVRSDALYRFTPSASATGGDRAITVAVRVDSDTANAVSVRNAAEQVSSASRSSALGVAPVKFNLGVAREYQSFAQVDGDSTAATRSLGLPSEIKRLDAPDLSSFTPAKSAQSDRKSRFSPQVAFEGETLPGRAPRTLRGEPDVSLDVGGAYRVADNLRVTAGIRYNSDRDRTVATVDGAQDSQSVYVGTRFRF